MGLRQSVEGLDALSAVLRAGQGSRRRGRGREVLQLCSHPVIGWPDAPFGLFGLRSIQMATI
jgi:hypothetical protein